MKISVILLDLGGILIELAGLKRMIELMKKEITPDELSMRWLYSKYVRLYESGRCSSEMFAENIVKELDMDITARDFLEEFPMYTKGFLPGAAELLQVLKQKYTLACLSNTNIIQWNSLCERISLDKYFHHSFLSFEMKKLKPEREIYTYVIKELGCAPGKIIFFDDNEDNVKAAVNTGMNAYQALGCADLKQKLETLNIICTGDI